MANANRGLGRGLGALLGDAALQTESADSLYLPISQVESCAGQPRKHFDDAALADLADSIREHGIIQPLTVRQARLGLLSDHCRRTPLAGCEACRSDAGARHRHRGGRPQGDGAGAH